MSSSSYHGGVDSYLQQIAKIMKPVDVGNPLFFFKHLEESSLMTSLKVIGSNPRLVSLIDP